MKILVLGTGGVGGYYGGLLARHGQEVTFAARGAHLEAMRREGLRVMSPHGDFHIQPVQAVEDPAEAGRVDLALVCTKTYSQEAIFSLKAAVGEETTVVALQNGVEAAERIGAVVGMAHMLGGATWISSAVEAPGVIRQVSQFRRVAVGELDGRMTRRVEAVGEAFRPTGVDFEITKDIRKVLWTKFIFIAAVSGMGGLTRLKPIDYRGIPETRALLTGLIGEVEALARGLGVELEADIAETTLAMVDASAAHIKSSFQRDLEAGKMFELEAIIGVIGQKGRECGLATPMADTIYAALLPALRKAGG